MAKACRGYRLRRDGGFDEVLQARSDDSFPLQFGALLPFSKPHCYGDKLHYQIPLAGDRSAFARSRRRAINVSSRFLFSQPGMQWMNYVRPA